jgi:lipopolysaccharide export system protein LptA
MCVWMWCLLLSGAGALLSSSVVHGADPALERVHFGECGTTTITSRTMTVSNQENTAIFDGAVVLTRGLLVVHSDHMVVSFHPNRTGADSKPAAGRIQVQVNSDCEEDGISGAGCRACGLGAEYPNG